MKTNLANLATFDRSLEASALMSFLRREGVHADLQDESRLQRFWFLVLPRAAVHVLVPFDEFERARGLSEGKAGHFLEERAVHCPACHSCRVQYPAVTRKNILPGLVAHVMSLLRLISREYYCEDCHHTWSPTPAPKQSQKQTIHENLPL